ncbi:MAG TPA: hypothetical protein DDY31_14065 [Lachnospiraceae bacterium]|nr:hypothetical protein [Lachnospiraceae bacterium]HBI62315.1 hypothetical protein [Lachnospiraceae bacterium]
MSLATLPDFGWKEADFTMDKLHYEEMMSNLDTLLQNGLIQNKKIYLFGHCNATEELAKVLLAKGLSIKAILDNNEAKQGKEYSGIAIRAPETIQAEASEGTVVCIVARAYAEMADQLRRLGYQGAVYRLADYNTYAEYSLAEETILRKKIRLERGRQLLEEMKRRHPKCFAILCPFPALGDVYLAMAYLPHFLEKRRIYRCGFDNCVIGVIGKACAEVVQIFGDYRIEILPQEEMDQIVQAVLYTKNTDFFIAHQDRPYAVNLHKALYARCIPLEQIYCCGVFGLPIGTKACVPVYLNKYADLGQMKKGEAVVLSPYAKSVTELSDTMWEEIVDSYLKKGYQCFTNVVGTEKPLANTVPISPAISEMQSVVEWAGTFIGIRSGICDVLKMAKCRKVALYPDYNYCDTKWKAIDMYALDGWENIEVTDRMPYGPVKRGSCQIDMRCKICSSN